MWRDLNASMEGKCGVIVDVTTAGSNVKDWILVWHIYTQTYRVCITAFPPIHLPSPNRLRASEETRKPYTKLTGSKSTTQTPLQTSEEQ
jgi:hypothetical protein